MATATATFTRNKKKMDVSERYVTHYGTVAIQASPATYATGGLTLDLSAVLSNDLPEDVNIYFDAPTGWLLRYSTGSTLKNGKVLLYGNVPTDPTAGTLPLGEFDDATAIPADVSGGTIKISFKTRKLR